MYIYIYNQIVVVREADVRDALEVVDEGVAGLGWHYP